MENETTCSELTTSGGHPLPCQEAWAEGCRCESCLSWQEAGGEDASDDDDRNPANAVERRDDGRWESTALTRALHAALEDQGGREALYRMVEGGLSAREICGVLGIERTDETAQAAIYRELNKDPDRYDRAKRASAEALAEKAGAVFGEDAPVTSADAKWRSDRSGYYRWLSELRSGRQPGGVNVNVDLGALYLGALQERGSMDLNPDRVPPTTIEAEYEEIEEDPND